MKTIIKKIKIVFAVSMVSFAAISCEKKDNLPLNNNNGSNGNNEAVAVITLSQINALPLEALSEAETADILYMREEEKLARDVYTTLKLKWGANVFVNISASEQVHMDALLMLIQKYNLTDPVVNNAVGIFTNTTLQELYTKLASEGSVSLAAAFKVGATIEDLDIFDLHNASLNTDNQDIHFVYDNLTKGSRNHLRAFYRNILRVGDVYTPQYITADEFNAIISGTTETGY